MHDSRGEEPRNRTNTNDRIYRKRDTFKRPNMVLSFFLYIIAIFLIFSFICLMVLRTAGISNIIQNTNFIYYLEEITVDEHEYYIVDKFNTMPFNNTELTMEDIEDFIKRDSVSAGINSVVEGYAQAFAMGNLQYHVTVEEVVQIAKELDGDISEFFNHDMTDDDIEYLAERLDDLLDFDSMTIDGLMEDFDMDMSVPLLIMSPAMRWSVGILSVLMLIVIFAVRRKYLPEASFAVGVPIALAGLVSFVAGIFLNTATYAADSVFSRFERFIEEPVTRLMEYGFIFAGAGVLIMIVAKTFSWAKGRA